METLILKGAVGKGAIARLLVACLLWSQSGHAQVYTGINQYGIRWFSDTPTETGAPIATGDHPRRPDVIPADREDHGKKESGKKQLHKKQLHKNRRANQRSNPVSKDQNKAVVDVKPKARTSSARRSKAGAVRTRQAQAETRRLRDAARLQKRCLRYENDLRRIRAQMRAGYTAAKGRQLRLRRQDLQTRQFDECPTR